MHFVPLITKIVDEDIDNVEGGSSIRRKKSNHPLILRIQVQTKRMHGGYPYPSRLPRYAMTKFFKSPYPPLSSIQASTNSPICKSMSFS
ncbi:hypothetical protein MgSA37_00420 [Mucilaginibacter gotjawali]|uniref:Uncharacterized protein n=2 Tax=Mucilaginibacter gotjawali TaxID=1550579 RepID=A0A110B034_9SPHI|nr:hypothetical protein [Mucilaginibacter gotjawali]BAU52265.1 hypothetical protein MgSA37_00420 [Mucilaginibacter gotjawali]